MKIRCLPVLRVLLFPLRKGGPEKEELKGVRERERERVEIVRLFMMRAGPISAQQFQAFQQFQRE